MTTKVQGNEQGIEQTSAVTQAQREQPLERAEEPRIVDEISVEELAIDGICGVY